MVSRFNLAVLLLIAFISGNATAQNNGYIHKSYNEAGEVVAISFFGDATWLLKQEDENSHLHHHKSLVSVTLNHHNILPDEIRYFAGLKTVQHLKIGEIPDEATISTEAVSCIRLMPELRSLSISTESDLTSLKWDFFESLLLLESLEIRGPLTLNLSSIDSIKKLPKLNELILDAPSDPSVLDGIKGLKTLRLLELHNVTTEFDVFELSREIPSLSRFDVYGASKSKSGKWRNWSLRLSLGNASDKSFHKPTK